MTSKSMPQHNNFDDPLEGQERTGVVYRTVWWNPTRWSSTKELNSWWDGTEANTPEEAVRLLRKRKGNDVVFKVLKVVTAVEVFPYEEAMEAVHGN